MFVHNIVIAHCFGCFSVLQSPFAPNIVWMHFCVSVKQLQHSLQRSSFRLFFAPGLSDYAFRLNLVFAYSGSYSRVRGFYFWVERTCLCVPIFMWLLYHTVRRNRGESKKCVHWKQHSRGTHTHVNCRKYKQPYYLSFDDEMFNFISTTQWIFNRI